MKPTPDPHRAPVVPDLYQFEAAGLTLAPAPADAAGPRTFYGCAYSGEVITSHPAWPALVIDLSDITLPAPCPTLLQHDRTKRVGVCTLAVTDGALMADGRLLRNEQAQAIAADADDGFPWQMSVHADPASIEEVGPGQSVTVNGRTFAGPLAVFRHVRIRELSFTPTGHDHRTQARVFSTEDGGETPPLQTTEESSMSVEALTAQVADLTAKLSAAQAQAEAAEAKLAQQARTARLAAVTATFADLGRQVTEADVSAYLALDEATWAQVARDLSAAKPKAPAYLFSEQATDGQASNAQATDQLVERMAKL